MIRVGVAVMYLHVVALFTGSSNSSSTAFRMASSALVTPSFRRRSHALPFHHVLTDGVPRRASTTTTPLHLMNPFGYRAAASTTSTLSRRHHNMSTLTKTSIWRMKKADMRMELSFRGMDTKGDRWMLLTRLRSIVDDPTEADANVNPNANADGSSSSSSSSSNGGNGSSVEPPIIDPSQLYILHIKGHTTPNSDGAGIGMVLYDPETERKLWSGRMYVPGERTPFEADYSAIIMAGEYAQRTWGVRRLRVQTSNDAIVQQIRGIYKIHRPSLQILREIEQELELHFDEFLMQEIPSADHALATSLAQEALATQKSMHVELKKKNKSLVVSDPMERVHRKPEQEPTNPLLQEEDSPSHTADMDTDIDPSRTYLLRFDGGSRGNPGAAGAGMVLYDEEGEEVWCGWKFHDTHATNNVAEYSGLLYGLKSAMSLGVHRLIVEGDSQLIVRQVNGEYRVKEETLKVYYKTCVDLAKGLEFFEIRHIYREENSRADSLANHAMDTEGSGGLDQIDATSILT